MSQFRVRFVTVQRKLSSRITLGYGRAFIASLSSTGITATANGVPASSLNCGSGLPNSLLPTLELS